ncbi:hypothetical protein CGA22_23450 [Pseudomonas sp. PSB18]|nr:hypothetical protein [Pseudomonas sp. PSB18]
MGFPMRLLGCCRSVMGWKLIPLEYHVNEGGLWVSGIVGGIFWSGFQVVLLLVVLVKEDRSC